VASLNTAATAYHSALRLLGRREYSVAELRAKLRRKHADLGKDALEAVLEDLQRDGLLSDLRYADGLFRSRVNRGYGPFFIQQEMATKGVPAEMVEGLLEAAEVDWRQLAQTLIDRRHPQARSDQNAWQKAARFLQRRGFSADITMRVLGEQVR